MGNKWGPGCCDCVSGECVAVDTVTLSSDDPCLAAFIGTWAMNFSSYPDPGTCSFDLTCRSHLTVFVGSSPANTCTPASTSYRADYLYLYAFGLNDGRVGINVQLVWLVGPSYLTQVSLRGVFKSTNYGVSFGAIAIDEYSYDCAAPDASDGPTNASDLACTVTLL